MRKLSILSSISIIVLLSGCSASPYVQNGTEVPEKNTYSLVITNSDTDHKVLKGLNETITFVEVDGKQLTVPLIKIVGPQQISILPEKHKFKVKYTWFNTFAYGCLELESQSGVNYVVKKKASSYSVTFWIETMDGIVAGNICGLGQVEKNS